MTRPIRLPEDVRGRLAESFPDLDVDRIIIRVGLPWWTRLAPLDVRAVALRDRICVDPDVDVCSREGIALIAHELVHVAQWRRAGRHAPPGLRRAAFPVRYIGAYLRARFRGMDGISAYRSIPYEREAMRFQRSMLASGRVPPATDSWGAG